MGEESYMDKQDRQRLARVEEKLDSLITLQDALVIRLDRLLPPPRREGREPFMARPTAP